MTTDKESRSWAPGWDGHAAAQRARWAKLSLARRIEWLEQAQRLAHDLGHDENRGRVRLDANAPPGTLK